MTQSKRPPSWYPDLWVKDRTRQNAAYHTMLTATSEPVDWGAAVWDDTVARLGDGDNHNRSIAAQLLCHLAVAEPDRAVQAVPDLVEVTRDKRFVTARHCLQALWRVAAGGQAPRDAVLDALVDRFRDCGNEKNATLIRADIVEALGRIDAMAPNEQLKQRTLQLIDTEGHDKYRAKYLRLWKSRSATDR